MFRDPTYSFAARGEKYQIRGEKLQNRHMSNWNTDGKKGGTDDCSRKAGSQEHISHFHKHAVLCYADVINLLGTINPRRQGIDLTTYGPYTYCIHKFFRVCRPYGTGCIHEKIQFIILAVFRATEGSSGSRRQICKARLKCTHVSQTRLLSYAHSNSQLFRLRLNCFRVLARRTFERRPSEGRW